jgi:tRNA(His) 5'-end guanylyltransferase
MKGREIFSNLISAPPIFIRIDGRSFHSLADGLALEKPFDEKFASAMVRVATRLLTESGLSPDLAFTFSDEINLYFTHLPFRGRVEKMDSVVASFAASALTLELTSQSPLSFDARVIQVSAPLATEYLINRQGEAWRNHINAYCQQALIGEGMSTQEAARALLNQPSRTLHDMMYRRGVNLGMTPTWQRRGILVFRKVEKRDSFDPRTSEPVEVFRSTVSANWELPLFSSPEGRTLLSSLTG